MSWALTLLAGALRFWALDLRPLHHDEGSNAIFILRLLHEGVYRYDPANYHGPTLYYLSALAIALFGTTTVALRIVPALLGTALIPLVWALRDDIGRAGAAAAALLLAFSPSLVYYSRDDIHEIYFIFLSLALLVALARGRRSGRLPAYVVGGAAAGGLVATKETAPIIFASLLAAAALSRGLDRRMFRPKPLLAFSAAALLLAGALYSRGFTDAAGLLGPVQSLRIWGVRAAAGDGHRKPWWYFLMILAREEGAILLPAVAGAAVASVRRARPALFLLGWSAATLAIYSAVPYKTPWLVLDIVLPMALLAGTAFEAAASGGSPRRRLLAGITLALFAGASLRQAIVVSFVRYDDDRIPLVYVQTWRDALRLVARIEEAAARDPAGRDLSIEILSPDYLPLNWYLRDFTNVGYHGHPIEHPGGPVVIARSDSADAIAALLGPEYTREEYDLRPGVRLCLFLRRPPSVL